MAAGRRRDPGHDRPWPRAPDPRPPAMVSVASSIGGPAGITTTRHRRRQCQQPTSGAIWPIPPSRTPWMPRRWLAAERRSRGRCRRDVAGPLTSRGVMMTRNQTHKVDADDVVDDGPARADMGAVAEPLSTAAARSSIRSRPWRTAPAACWPVLRIRSTDCPIWASFQHPDLRLASAAGCSWQARPGRSSSCR